MTRRVVLPLACNLTRPPDPPRPGAGVTELRAPRPVRVLNVDDGGMVRDRDDALLRREGFQVFSASTGLEALRGARGDIDVAIVDVDLEDIDGLDVCRRLKDDPVTAGVIVLLTSASRTASQDKVAGLEAGADGYLVQPFEDVELVATIRSLLRARAAERRAQALAQELRRR